MTKAQIINLLCSSSNMMDEQEDLTEYIKSLDWNNGQDVQSLHDGYNAFKIEKMKRAIRYRKQTRTNRICLKRFYR